MDIPPTHNLPQNSFLPSEYYILEEIRKIGGWLEENRKSCSLDAVKCSGSGSQDVHTPVAMRLRLRFCTLIVWNVVVTIHTTSYDV